MWRFLKAVLAAVAARVVRDYQRLAVDRLKIQAARCYVKSVAGARLAVIGYLAAIAGLLLALAGFILLHVAVFILLPFGPREKALLLLALGVLYLAVPLLALRRAMSQATWMKVSRADELVAKVTARGGDRPSA